MSRLFLIGAGFSRYAGLPLGSELAREVIKKSKEIVHKDKRGILYENVLSADLERFINYKKDTQGAALSEDNIDLEEFITFLDIEHFLKFKGGDVYSGEADRSQQIVKNIIAQIIWEKQQMMTIEQWDVYIDFASRLRPRDLIITFNYDTILEEGLEKAGVAYRLVPDRYETVSEFYSQLTQEDNEVVVLKVHGSIDWFDIKPWLDNEKFWERQPAPKPKNFHPIFSNVRIFEPTPIVGDPFPEDSGLRRIHRVSNLGVYFDVADYVLKAPLMLAPSHQKLLYSNPLKEFWWGMRYTGAYSESLGIIGFSLPSHDQYAVQAFYEIITNYQEVDDEWMVVKSPLRFVDFCNLEGIEKLKQRYCFTNWAKVELDPGGFRRESVHFLFRKTLGQKIFEIKKSLKFLRFRIYSVLRLGVFSSRRARSR